MLQAPDATSSSARTAPNVLMVSPLFLQNTFWNLRETIEIQGARNMAPPLGLLTVAAMLPPSWNVRLIDCNTRTLTDADLAGVDLVMTGGMLPQELGVLRVMSQCKRLGVPVCVGGPAPTSTPEFYEEADFLVIGEAETVIGDFIAAWERGDSFGRFQADKFKADVTRTPIPRFELINFKDYLYVNLQFSRGCPFTCEFCDIIELYGRAPRTKTAEQTLAELDRLLELGHRGHVDFVDDNLIGNKKAIKLFLPKLIEWQKARGYPFKFFTEASINLADDPELLAMMREANFFGVFIGIESPDEETLVQTSKKQNARRSIADSVHKVYEAGMFVIAGFIVGFDSEKSAVSRGVIDCIRDTGIPTAVVGLLYALPNTQLSRRLEREGRMFGDFRSLDGGDDQCTAGLNFRTLRPRRDVLVDYRAVLAEIYDPDVFFDRVRMLGRKLNRPNFNAGKGPDRAAVIRDLKLFGRVVWRMTVLRPKLATRFWGAFVECARNNPRALQYVVANMLIYLHVQPFTARVIAALDKQIAAIDAGRFEEPEPLPANDDGCSTSVRRMVAAE